MEEDEQPKIDLQKYMLPKAKKGQFIKLLIYALIIVGVLIYVWRLNYASEDSTSDEFETEMDSFELN